MGFPVHRLCVSHLSEEDIKTSENLTFEEMVLVGLFEEIVFFEDIFGQVSPLKIPSLQELHSLAGNATVLDHMFTK